MTLAAGRRLRPAERPGSRQLRFLRGENELSPAELRYFTGIDRHDHEALGAMGPADGRGVGIARYIRDHDDPQAAEIAVTSVDDWQGRGLGTELLAQLSDRAWSGHRGVRDHAGTQRGGQSQLACSGSRMICRCVGNPPAGSAESPCEPKCANQHQRKPLGGHHAQDNRSHLLPDAG